jgi:hypothetical protein
MKQALTTFAILIGSLFAPVAASAAPLICNGPSGLVYALASSCATANVGVFPGFTVGNCLVIQADFSLGGGACGGGGGPTLAGTQTWTGVNTYTNTAGGLSVGTSGVDGPRIQIQSGSGGFNVPNFLGANSTHNCAGVNGDFLYFGDALGGGDVFTISSANAVGFCNNPVKFSHTVTLSGSPALVDASNNSASMQLGQSGAPSGACVSGSIYTRSDGTVGAAEYICYGSVWHASAT